MKFCLRNSSWVALSITLSGSGCVVEKIDAIIAEHGVTYWPSSTDEGSESSTGKPTRNAPPVHRTHEPQRPAGEVRIERPSDNDRSSGPSRGTIVDADFEEIK